MRRGVLAVGLVVWTAALAPAAAPPVKWRALTDEEQQELDALHTKLQRHAYAHEFEQAARVAQQMADYRRQRQGASHWEAIDERYEAEAWRRAPAIPAADRAEALRAMILQSRGIMHQNEGRLAEAQKCYRQALAVREKLLGKRHPDTASSRRYLASCLQAQGRPAEALPLVEEALEALEAKLGKGHPHVAEACQAAASCLLDLRKSSPALALARRALAIREATFGEDHRDTATACDAVALCLHRMGRLAEALTLFRRGLDIRQKVLGEDHPETLRSYNNVAITTVDLGRPGDALPLSRRALALCRRATAVDDATAATCYDNLGGCLASLGRYGEALPALRKAVALREAALGKGHPDTAISSSNLAACLNGLNDNDEALPLFRDALRMRRAELGPAHPFTAISVNNLAGCFCRRGEHARAARLWQEALPALEVARFHSGTTGFDRAQGNLQQASPRAMLAVVLARLGQPRNAFAHAEASLARGLLDDLAGQGAAPRELADRLRELETALARLAGRDRPNAEETAAREKALREHARLSARLSGLLAEASARLVLPAERIQRAIPDDGALVLWVDADPVNERWGCVLRSKGVPRWERIDGSGPGGAWTGADESLQGKLYDRLRDPASGAAERRELLAAFAERRLAPLRRHLKAAGDLPAVKRLFVVPTGPMALVPAELLDEKLSVSYVPSGSVFAMLRQTPRRVSGGPLLALGDPKFDLSPPPEPPTSGALIKSVLPGGAAARAGLRPGDVLLSVGGTAVGSLDDLQGAPRELPAKATFWRDGATMTTRLPAGGLGAVFDPRSARAAVRAWRNDQESVATRGTGHKRLPGTRTEAEAIAAMVRESTLLLGSDASEQKLDALREQGKLKRYRILHFATHGEADGWRPANSALVLAQDRLPDPLRQVRQGDTPTTGG